MVVSLKKLFVDFHDVQTSFANLIGKLTKNIH